MNQLLVAGTLSDFTSSEHPLLGSDHYFRRELGRLTKQSCVIDKAGYIAGYESIKHATYTNNFACENPRIDRCLGVVSHDATHELHRGRRTLTAILHIDRAIGIF